MSNAVFNWQPGADLFQKWLFSVAEAIEDRPGAGGANRPGSRPDQYTGRDPYAGDPLVFGARALRQSDQYFVAWRSFPYRVHCTSTDACGRTATRPVIGLTRVKTPKTDGFVERLNGIVLDDFFRTKNARDLLRDRRRSTSRSRRLSHSLRDRKTASRQALLRFERVLSAEAAAKELVVKPHVVGCDAKIDDLIQNRPYEAIIVDAGILRQRECRAWTLPNVQT